MHQMIELHPKADALDVLGLPAIPYPVALPAFQAAVANDGELPLAEMLRGLQLRAADPRVDWQRLAPAMARLAELLAGEDDRDPVIARGDGWALEATAAAPDGPAMELQRGDATLALVSRGTDGRLRVAAYLPLDAGAIDLLRGMAAHDRRDGDAGPRERCGSTGVGEAGPHRLVPRHAAAGGGSASLPAGQAPAARRPACVAAEILAATSQAPEARAG